MMKKLIALAFTAALLLSGCSFVERAQARPSRDGASVSAQPNPTAPAAPADQPAGSEQNSTPTEVTTEPTAAPETTEATTAPTEPKVYFNPLNGTILEEPYTGRIIASTISNIREALPHVGVNQADILMEMFVNGSIDRCLALFTNVKDVEQIGSVRSTRLMFSDIVQHYNAVLCYAGGSDQAVGDVTSRGIDNINLDRWEQGNTWSIRDKEREKKIGLEHSLMGIGNGILEYIDSHGIAPTSDPEADYFLRFTEDGTPADGEDASNISVTLTYGKTKKETVMVYNAETGKYVFNQYNKEMRDGRTDEPEAFRNVIVMHTNISMNNIYHVADFVAGGTGYFACGGKIIPIKWECDNENAPFRFLTESGEILELGQGNTYIAICSPESPVVYS